MRYWTVDEARGYLPRVKELLEILGRSLPASLARGNGHRESSAERQRALEPAREAMAELETNGIVVRDLSIGLIDFPAMGRDGVTYLLCWQSSEPDLSWWHLPEEGFAGRKPLPRPDY